MPKKRLSKIVRSARKAKWSRHEHAWFYNLRVGRPMYAVKSELEALAESRPLYISVVEAVGYNLPELDGYRLIRDTSTRSRANVAIYASTAYKVSGIQWHDMTSVWGRTHAPGNHEPRSFLSLRIGLVQVIVAHQPPRYTNNVEDAQQEQIEALAHEMAPWKRKQSWKHRSRTRKIIERLRPRIVNWDANRVSGERGPGPDTLAHAIGGKVIGWRIDNAVCRHLQADFLYRRRVSRVTMRSDHPHALRLNLRVGGVWLPRNH